MNRVKILGILTLVLFSFTGNTKPSNSTPVTLQNNSKTITRDIDATQHFRPFPELTVHRNTSLQKATTPVLAEFSRDAYGKAKITRCWLNLDEMWDYRTREFNFNFQVGVDKYKDIKEKHRETWNREVESPIHFYDYLNAFSTHSEEIMLTIRRYERDILDGKLPVSKEDYKMIFKTGLKHYKKLFPNIRYVQVGNEYHLNGFMGATDEEYYKFYKLGYEAVNEVNEEMRLEGSHKILVGHSPPTTVHAMTRLDKILELFSIDNNITKRIDFISWHEYSKPISETANREKAIRSLMKKHGLPENLQLFITEHDPYHGSRSVDQLLFHTLNTAYLPKSLYFTSILSPGIIIFPWVLYHDRNIQTKFMWFDGPNEPETKAYEMKMLPLGASMKMLSKHKGREIKVNNSLDSNDLVLASVQKDKIILQAINYDAPKDVKLLLNNICKIFPELKNERMKVVKYLIDSNHSNCLTKPEHPGGLEKVDEYEVEIDDNTNVFKHKGLEKYGLVLWEVIIN